MAEIGFRPTSAQDMNALTIFDYLNRLEMLACSMFEWSGMPEGISVRFLENTLYNKGYLIFVHDQEFGYMVTKAAQTDKLNIYGEPTGYTAYATGGYTRHFKQNECILIRNNYKSLPTESTIRLFAQRLFEVERTLDVNIKAQKHPIVILCDEKQRLTLMNIYKQWNGNEPIIYGEKNLVLDSIKTIDTKSPYVGDKLMLYKHDLFNDCMTFLGVKNANTDKKERLITDEVQANDDQIELSAQVMLLTRQQACKQINEKYGLNVSVNLRVLNEKPEQEPEKEKGAAVNG